MEETIPSIREVVADSKNEIEKAQQPKEIDVTPAEEAGTVSPVAGGCAMCHGEGWVFFGGIGEQCLACEGTGDAHAAIDVPLMKSNQIRVLTPWKEGAWVFDDPTVGLNREPFVTSFGEIIDTMVKGIKDAEDGFMLWFSGEPFEGANEVFSLANKDGKENRCGNDYKYDKDGRIGWLCPAMYKYFNIAPQNMYFKCEALANKRPVIGRKLEAVFEKFFTSPQMLHKMMREMAGVLGYHVSPSIPDDVTKTATDFFKLDKRFKAEKYVTKDDKYYWSISMMGTPEEVAAILAKVYELVGAHDLRLFAEHVEVDGKKFGTVRVETGVYEPEDVFSVSKYPKFQGWGVEGFNRWGHYDFD